MTLKSAIGNPSQNSDKIERLSEHDNNEMSFEDARLTSAKFSTADKEKLVGAVTEQTQISDLIDWQSIAENVFKGAYSAQDCIYEFLKLPISESLNLNIESCHEEA